MRFWRTSPQGRIVDIPVARIQGNPYQPRRDVDETHLQQLTQSIATHGVIVPIIVRPRQNGKDYELVAGQRRLLACRRLGWKSVPALIRHYDEQQVMEVGLLENLQRRNLSAVEEAEALNRLSQEFVRLPKDDLARRMGVDPRELQQREDLLGLSMVAREAVITGLITNEHALAILPLPTEEEQVQALSRIHREDLSVTQTRRMVEAMLSVRPQPAAPVPAAPGAAAMPPLAERDRDGIARLDGILRGLLREGRGTSEGIDALAARLLERARDEAPADFLDLGEREANGLQLAGHAWNVAKLAVFVGSRTGLTEAELGTLCRAALLYDVGMLSVPPEILLKQAPLEPSEVERIRRHPEDGAKLLEQVTGLDPAVLQVALEHHERSDGTGYPRSAKEAQTHPLSRLISVTDCFEAATAPRAHRPPAPPRLTMQAIVLGTYKGAYDRDTVRRFLQALSLYPVGSRVKLGTGETARVVRCVPTDVTRPVVQVLFEADGRPASPPREINLSETPGLAVSDGA